MIYKGFFLLVTLAISIVIGLVVVHGVASLVGAMPELDASVSITKGTLLGFWFGFLVWYFVAIHHIE